MNHSHCAPSTLPKASEDERIVGENTPRKKLRKSFLKRGEVPQLQSNHVGRPDEFATRDRKFSKEKSYLEPKPPYIDSITVNIGVMSVSIG